MLWYSYSILLGADRRGVAAAVVAVDLARRALRLWAWLSWPAPALGPARCGPLCSGSGGFSLKSGGVFS